MQIVLSASRRTDIPAFFMPWFMQSIARQRFRVRHPLTQKIREVAAGPDRVHTIVFWSKNFGPFLENRYGEKLQKMGYHLFFNFTVNSENSRLEPRVPPLCDRLAQLGEMAERFGPGSLQWRFDPVLFYRDASGAVCDNLEDFEPIADAAAGAGIGRCVTSFLDLYPKVVRRSASISDFSFVDPPPEKKAAVLCQMETVLAGRGIGLSTCCEKEVIGFLPPDTTVRAGGCIAAERLMALFGGRLSVRKDSGQRSAQGCRCTFSADIGSYREHPCGHSCSYCYANPV